MSKYKIGDRVIVEKSNVDHLFGSHEGKVGTVVAIINDVSHPYQVALDDDATLWCTVKGFGPKYKIGDRVIIEESNIDVDGCIYRGLEGVIRSVDVTVCGYDYLVSTKKNEYGVWCKVKCLVEEKKMFTAKDLKTGMFGVTDKGEKFVIVNDLMIYDDGGYDIVSHVRDDMTIGLRHITKVYDGIKSFKMLEGNIGRGSNHGTLVYKYEVEKPLYNGKVVCIDNKANHGIHTVGKVYQFKDGQLTADNGRQYPGVCGDEIYTFEDWDKWTSSKFIEVKE